MQGICLRFYAYESHKYHGILMYEWLLEFAKKNGIHGGSVFRAIAGYGRHGTVHEEHFFELASNVPVEIVFITTEKEVEQFLSVLKKEKIDLFYTKTQVEYESLNSCIEKI